MKFVHQNQVVCELGVFANACGIRCDEVRLSAADMAALCNPKTPDADIRERLREMASRFVPVNGLRPT